MRKILARTLLQYSTSDLFEMLTGKFILVFDDGMELETTAKKTLFSSYAWMFHKQYPKTPLLLEHHVDSIIGNGRLGNNSHLALLGVCMWAVYDTYINDPNVNEVEFRDILAKQIYELTNEMYNDLTIRCEEHTASLDIVNFIDLINHKGIEDANDSILPTQRSIDQTYSTIKDILLHDDSLNNNPVALAVRSKLVNMEQVLQCISARGFITDTDSVLFPIPITTGYVKGIRSFYDSLIESRSAAKSLMFSKTPLQQAEYFSRRLQLMSQVVQNLHMGDCGSTEYLLWHVRDKDLKELSGKHYVDNGIIKTVSANDTKLIGCTIKLRMAIHCRHPDPAGICSTCFGELAYSVPKGTNIGQMCSTSLAQKSSQNVLSTKHYDGSSVVVGITLNDHYRKYLKVVANDNSYALADNIKHKHVYLILPVNEASNLTDILEVDDVSELNITRISALSEIGIMIGDHIESFKVSLNQRLASITTPLLNYIKTKGWTVDKRENYVINMSGWDWSNEILTLPLKHISMGDHSSDIAKLLESSVDKLKERDKFTTANSAIVELFDLVNDKLKVNLAVLDVVFYATMIIGSTNYLHTQLVASTVWTIQHNLNTPANEVWYQIQDSNNTLVNGASLVEIDNSSFELHFTTPQTGTCLLIGNDDNKYGLPKPFTESGLGIMKVTMANRSLSAAMAFEQHRSIITSPSSYINTNRIDHPMDKLLCYY